MKSFFAKTLLLSLLVNLLCIPVSFAKPKKLKPAPSKTEVIVDGVPDGTLALVVPLVLDSSVVEISSATSNVGSALVVTDKTSVGILQTSGSLPSMINFSVSFKGLKRGKTTVSAGEVTDKKGGTAISGVTATSSAKKVKVK